MKILSYLLLVFCIAGAGVSPAALGEEASADSSGWFWQNPYPQGNTMYDVAVLDLNTAVCVGGSSTVARTSDGGLTWKITGNVADLRVTLRSVSFIDNHTGLAAGDDGRVLYTSDGGLTWALRGPGLGAVKINAVKLYPRKNGTGAWAAGAGGAIFKSSDLGLHWITEPSGTFFDLHDISPVSDTIAFSAGDFGTIRKTLNGGAAWDSAALAGVTDFRGAFFADKLKGWLCDNSGRIVRTVSGGDSWIATPIVPGLPLNDVAFFTASPSGIAVGNKGFVTVSNDFGITWSAQPDTLDSTATLQAVGLKVPFTAWTVGQFGRMWRSTNGGGYGTWVERSSGNVPNLKDISFINSQLGWAVGDDHTMLYTNDGGNDWASRVIPVNRQLNGIAMLSFSRGFIAGESGTLLETTDGGAVWTSIPLATNSDFHAIRFGDSFHGTAVGDLGIVAVTTDGGFNWSLTRIDSALSLTSVTYSAPGIVWATADSSGIGKLYSSTDAGLTWRNIPTEPARILTSISFATPLLGVVTGTDGKIMRTTDGGVEWRPRAAPQSSDFNRVYLLGDNFGWIAGNGGTMLKTTDGGLTWNSLASGTDLNLHALQFIDSLTGWIGGDGGAILKTTDGGGKLIEYIPPPPPLPLPQKVSLLANFPNPFNPRTHIAYEIAEPTNVDIIIYDILGRKVRELPQGHQNSGRYDGSQYPAVVWDGLDQNGTQLASGVYFYTIVTTEVRESSKMLMIR